MKYHDPKPRGITFDIADALLNYDASTGILTWKVARKGKAKQGTVAGTKTGSGYISVFVMKKPYKAHHLAWLLHHKTWPPSDLDHINRVRADNRIENLRIPLQSQQNFNTKLYSNNTTGRRGVSFHKATGKYIAHFSFCGKFVINKEFDTFEDAVIAREQIEGIHVSC